jgi:hypothetical protein
MTAKVLVAFVTALCASIAVAQMDFEGAIADTNKMVSEVNEFIADIRFDEGDIQKMVELWADYESNQTYEPGEDDNELNFDKVISDPKYRSWAASHGLDAEDFMRKTTRITMMLFAEQMQASMAMMREQMPEQLAMIEAQKDQVGEELYQQMKQGMEESQRYSEMIAESWSKLGKPTAAEQRALDAYRDELTTLMESDDEDEYGDEYYGDEYYDEEYDEDYDEEDW